MILNPTFPALPKPPSWYPGHMRQFIKNLPKLLKNTDVVLEVRDARLPLTSINGDFESALRQWRFERQMVPRRNLPEGGNWRAVHPVCERIVILNKRDLIADWGVEPFLKVMNSRYRDQRVVFASCNKPRDIKILNEMLVRIGNDNSHLTELNVMVMGMPNVGKSTLLNALRNSGIEGPTPKALMTSGHPGLTRALSNRLKLSEKPLVYAYDSPGVMLPFLGNGPTGAERAVKLCLIAGIKEGHYDDETLAAYLLYRMNVLNPSNPTYLTHLPLGTVPTDDPTDFLEQLARRLGMVRRGGELDVRRAARWFVQWWRQDGGLTSHSNIIPSTPLTTYPFKMGWGFDFEWTLETPVCSGTAVVKEQDRESRSMEIVLRSKMEEVIAEHERELLEEQRTGGQTSKTQGKKKSWQSKMAKRVVKGIAKRLAKTNAQGSDT